MSKSHRVARRTFLKTAGAAALASSVPSLAQAATSEPPEAYVKELYDSLTDAQRQEICFAWDYVDVAGRGLLRTRISNNWDITGRTIGSGFYTRRQKDLIRAIFEGLYQPEWVAKIE
jgi:hypothetical protein